MAGRRRRWKPRAAWAATSGETPRTWTAIRVRFRRPSNYSSPVRRENKKGGDRAGERQITKRDLIAVLERDPNYRKSDILHRLLERDSAAKM